MNYNNKKVLIVGAGISGLYASMKLKTLHPDMDITIIEQNSFTGGRIFTEKWGNFILEHGPMRFEPDLQPKFNKLITELNIETIDFSPYTSTFIMPDFNKLEINEINAISSSNFAPAFALVKYALTQILKDIWDLDVKYIQDREERKTHLKQNAKYNGHYLYEQGLWDVFSCVLSKEAIDYVQSKGTFYHMLAINPNAADMICFMIDIIDTANDKLITMKNGSNEIIKKIEKRVNLLGVKFIFNKTVTEFFNNEHNVTVKTDSNDVFVADRVIFTLPQKAYSDINGFSTSIKTLIQNSIMLLELFKLFVIFTNPPFDEDSIPIVNKNADKIPCRELHYSYDPLEKLGMLQIYGDFPSINFWNTCLRRKAQLSSSDNTFNDDDITKSHRELLIDHIQRSLKKLFPEKNCELKHYSIINWSNPPLSTGVHFWRPGYQSLQIMDKLHKLGNVHICGETFSTYQGFIEGALISVDKVVESFV